MKIAASLPLFDQRMAGLSAREAAPDQTLKREQCEIVVVVRSAFGTDPTADAHARRT